MEWEKKTLEIRKRWRTWGSHFIVQHNIAQHDKGFLKYAFKFISCFFTSRCTVQYSMYALLDIDNAFERHPPPLKPLFCAVLSTASDGRGSHLTNMILMSSEGLSN